MKNRCDFDYAIARRLVDRERNVVPKDRSFFDEAKPKLNFGRGCFFGGRAGNLHSLPSRFFLDGDGKFSGSQSLAFRVLPFEAWRDGALLVLDTVGFVPRFKAVAFPR